MKLGDRFYRAMSEWRCARFRDRHLATEENAYELYWFNRLDHFYGPELDFEVYNGPGTVFYNEVKDDCFVFVVSLPRKWNCQMHYVDLYFNCKTGEYVKMKRSLKRKMREDEREQLRYLAKGYFNRLHEYNFVVD